MKPIYRCDFCGILDTEDKMREHEAVCNYNPLNKTCYTCKHYYRKGNGWQKCEMCNAGVFNNSPLTKISEMDLNIPHKQCEKYEYGAPTIIPMRGV